MSQFIGINFQRELSAKNYAGIEELIRAAIAFRTSADANYSLDAMLKNDLVIKILKDHPDMHNRLLSYAVKLSYPTAVGLLLSMDISLAKAKDIVKVLIKALAYSPDLFDENYQVLQLLCANESFRKLLAQQVGGLLKQVNRDLNDKKALKSIKEGQGLGAIDEQRLRAVQSVILELQKYEDASKLIDTSKYSSIDTHKDAVEFVEAQKTKAQAKKDKLKLVKTVDQFSSLNLGEFRTPAINAYVNELISAIKADDQEKTFVLLDRANQNFGHLTPVELNQLLHVALVFRANKALRTMLSKPQFQACVAGPAFRNRLLCFAIDTANPAAATAFLEIAAVGTRMEQTSKDILKNLIRATAYMPDELSKEIVPVICNNTQFRKVLTEEYQSKQDQQGILAILKEIAKDMRGDIDDDVAHATASKVTNPNARIDAVKEIMAYISSNEDGVTMTTSIARQADKVAALQVHKKFDLRGAANKLAGLLNKKSING